MLRSIPLGKLFGIPLYIHPTFLLLPAWVVFSHPGGGLLTTALLVLGVLAVFGCVVLHELGHALAARHYGIRTRDITLYPIGGVARLERISEKPIEELVIALAGPAVNLVIVLLLAPAVIVGAALGHGFGLISPQMGLLGAALQFLILIWVSNIVLLVFNLIPAFPMDGGRVLRALLSMGLGQVRATEIAAVVGLVLACILGAIALASDNWMMVILAVFVVLTGQAELRMLRAREVQRRADQRLAHLFEPVPAMPTMVLRGDSTAPHELNPTFSGFTWHQERGVWVAWRNGLPVGFWGPTE